MAITTGLTNSFKKELLQAIHNFDPAGDTFKVALYDAAATLGAATLIYATTNEVTGAGYTAGGVNIDPILVDLDGNTAVVDFDDVVIPNCSVTARGALIYNASKGNKTVAVFDFGANKTSTDGDFKITMPTPDASNALIRVA